MLSNLFVQGKNLPQYYKEKTNLINWFELKKKNLSLHVCCKYNEKNKIKYFCNLKIKIKWSTLLRNIFDVNIWSTSYNR